MSEMGELLDWSPERVKEELQERDETVVRYDDSMGHQYWSWEDGELLRLTQINSSDVYQGPFPTADGLLAEMVENGDLCLVKRLRSAWGSHD